MFLRESLGVDSLYRGDVVGAAIRPLNLLAGLVLTYWENRVGTTATNFRDARGVLTTDLCMSGERLREKIFVGFDTGAGCKAMAAQLATTSKRRQVTKEQVCSSSALKPIEININ